VRHRQTKEAATDKFSLQQPRHTSTLPEAVLGIWTVTPSGWFSYESRLSLIFSGTLPAAEFLGRLGWCSATRNMVVAETAAWYRDENERKGV